MLEYDVYLPHINVNDGKARVMNNLKLYTTLLGKFKGRQMTDELLEAVNAGDSARAVQHAHALRGTAANLGFPVLQKVTEEIETLCKAEQSCGHLCDELDKAMIELEAAITQFINTPAEA